MPLYSIPLVVGTDLSTYKVTPTGGTQVTLADAIATLTPGLGTDVTFDDVIATTLSVPTLTGATATHSNVTATISVTAPLTTADKQAVTDGSSFATGRSLVPGFLHPTLDAAGNVAGGVRLDGTLDYYEMSTGVLTATTAALGTTTVSSMTAGDSTIAGVTLRASSMIPGWSLPFQDASGNIAGGVREDGRLEMEHIVTGTLDVTVLNSPAFGAVDASIVKSDIRVPATASSVYIKDTAGNIGEFRHADGSLDVPLAPGVAARHVRQVARPSFRHTYTPPTTGPDIAVTSGTTVHTVWSLTLPFDYVRLWFARQTVGTSTIIASVAPSASFSDGVNPLNEAGGAQAWTRALFAAGGGFDHEPWTQPTGGADSITPAGSSLTGIWAWTCSDWVQASSMDRIDGGMFPLLMVRTHFTGSGVAAQVSGTGWMGTTPQLGGFGRTWTAYETLGDFVTTTSGYPSGGGLSDKWAPLIVETYSRQAGYQVWGCGDSNMAGVGSGLFGQSGFLRRSAYQVGLRSPVVVSNLNQSGQSPDIYLKNLERIVDVARPSALVLFPFSFNAPATEANLNAHWARSMALANRVVRNGGVPILVGYPPRTGITQAEDDIRLKARARLLAAQASGVRVVDINPFIATGVSPQTWVPGTSDDLVHFSDLGHCLVADRLTPELIDALGV